MPGLRRIVAVGLVIVSAVSAAAAYDGQAIKAPLASKSLLLDAAFAGSRLISVGERGHILLSDDYGDTWRQANVDIRSMLTAVHMHDARLGWAVGHDSVILHTSDGGETWTTVHKAPEDDLPLLDIWFRDDRFGLAVGAFGTLLASEDGGMTWAQRAIGDDDYHLNAIASAGPRLFLAAEAGIAYRSDDGGLTWERLETPYNGSWFGALALDPERIVLFGLRGHMYRSNDGGDTWTQVETGTHATLTCGARHPSGQIVIAGLEGVILRSRDDGQNVSLHQRPLRRGAAAVLALPDDTTLIFGENGAERLPGIE